MKYKHKILLNLAVLSSVVMSFLGSFVLMTNLINKNYINISAYSDSNYTLIDNKYAGRILKIDNNQIIIDSQQGIKEFNLSDNASVTKNGLAANFQSLSTADYATISVDNTGNITSVNSFTGIIADFGEIIIPTLGILLILLGITLIFVNKKQKGFVKTKITNLK